MDPALLMVSNQRSRTYTQQLACLSYRYWPIRSNPFLFFQIEARIFYPACLLFVRLMFGPEIFVPSCPVFCPGFVPCSFT